MIFKRKEIIIHVIIEFSNNVSALTTIAKISDYISNLNQIKSIETELQSYPSGYKISYKILCYKDITKKLSNFSSWLDEKANSIHKFNCVTTKLIR